MDTIIYPLFGGDYDDIKMLYLLDIDMIM